MEEIKFTPSDLKTGMFGVTSNGNWFIVVNDIIVYQDYGWDKICNLYNDMSFPDGTKIERVYKDCNSFDKAKKWLGTQVYPIPIPKLTLSQIKQILGFDFELLDK